jgi:predicted ATPase
VITYAHIQHYKSISDASLHLRPINVIVGPNGSGKSNVMDAIYFLHDCAVSDIDTAITKRHGIDSLRQWSRTRPYNINITIAFRNHVGSGNYKVIISSNRGNFRILEESGQWHGPHPYLRPRDEPENRIAATFKRNENGEIAVTTDDVKNKLPQGLKKVSPEELFLQYLNSRLGATEAIYFRSVFNELSSFSRYSIYPNILRNPQIISRELTLEEDGSNLSSILKRMNTSKRYGAQRDSLVDSLGNIMANITDIQVKSAAGFYVPVIRVREHNNDIHDFNLSQISDGTLRTLGLLTAFYQPAAPNKIGIEEPELMIHPGALQVIKDAMDTFIADKKEFDRQVFITTHSPTLIDLFLPEDIIWAKMNQGLTECSHIRKRQLDIIKNQLFSAGELLLAEGLF